MIKNIVLFVCLLAGISVYSQDNPKINRDQILLLAEDTKAVKTNLKQGDKYYKKGLYDAALSYYMKLYHIIKDHAPLNYKIGVSNLYGINPKNALNYFNQSDPSVTADYYFRKGVALIYQNQYEQAKEAFHLYLESLTPRRRQRASDMIDRFIAICDFSETALRDSIPVFIENLGPNVNSFYDEYSAIETLYPTQRLFFTSRRPKDSDPDITDRSQHKELILYSPEFINGKANEAQSVSKTGSGKHLSIAGGNTQESTLFYYRSKKRFGDIYRVRFKENGISSSVRRLKKGISKKPSKETSITFAANGDAYFISDRMGGEGGKDIWYSQKKGKRTYRRAKNLGSSINTPLTEEGVYVTPDGNTLYFSSNGRPGLGGFDVYKVQKEDGIWGEPVNMGYPINSLGDDLFYRLTSDSTIALLSSERSGGFGGLDVYTVRTDLSIPFELSGSVTDAASGKNLAATVKLFDRAHNLPLATAKNDSATGKYLISMADTGSYYLQAEAMGYRSVTEDLANPQQRHAKVEKNFALEKLLHPFSLTGHITNLKTRKPVHAEIILKAAGKDEELYRAVSDENTGFYAITLEDKLNVDITVKAPDYFDHNEQLLLKNIAGAEGRKDISLQRSVITYTLSGVIANEERQPVKASLNITKTGEAQTVQTLEADENGKYELTTTDAGPFLLEITAEGYFFINGAVRFSDDSTLIVKNFTMQKMQSGAKIVIENILFNTGNATLRPESFVELNKLVNLLKENPTVKIEVSGHTDNVGSAAMNKKLSKNRALAVRNYLLSQGIVTDRVEYEGYGFDRPLMPNDTEEGRAVNRRVEIEILD